MRKSLIQVANKSGLPVELSVKREEYDAWFRAKVLEAMNDSRPGVVHDQVEALFANKRAKAQKRLVRG